MGSRGVFFCLGGSAPFPPGKGFFTLCKPEGGLFIKFSKNSTAPHNAFPYTVSIGFFGGQSLPGPTRIYTETTSKIGNLTRRRPEFGSVEEGAEKSGLFDAVKTQFLKSFRYIPIPLQELDLGQTGIRRKDS